MALFRAFCFPGICLRLSCPALVYNGPGTCNLTGVILVLWLFLIQLLEIAVNVVNDRVERTAQMNETSFMARVQEMLFLRGAMRFNEEPKWGSSQWHRLLVCNVWLNPSQNRIGRKKLQSMLHSDVITEQTTPHESSLLSSLWTESRLHWYIR